MNQKDIADIVLEAIEVFLNHILYIREVYPQQIFKKRRVYNTPVFISIFPPLNSYLLQVLRTARELLRSQELESVELLIYRNEYHTLERYTCEISEFECSSGAEDLYLLHFEEQLRSALYKVAERLSQLVKLPNDAKFKIQLHTTQSGFVRLSHNSHYQEFPWLQVSQRNEPDMKQISILPLTTINTVGLKFQVEV